MFFQKSLHKSWRMWRRIVVTKLPVSTCPQLQPFSSYRVPQPMKDFDVELLSYCLAWSVLMVDNLIKKKTQNGLYVAPTWLRLLRTWRLRWFPLGRLGFCFRVIAIYPWLISSYDLFGEMWVFVSGFKSSVNPAWNSFCSCDRTHETNFAVTSFLPRSSVNISETIICGIPSASSNSCTVNRQFLLIAARTHSTFLGVLLVAGLPECGSLSTDFHPSLKCWY